MGDIGHSELQALLQGANLLAHGAAQAGIQVGQGFVEQQHGGLQRQRAGQRHALLLPARQLMRPALVQTVQAHGVEHGARLVAHLLTAQARKV